VATAINHPEQTTRRALEDLEVHHVVTKEAVAIEGTKRKATVYRLTDDMRRAYDTAHDGGHQEGSLL
jgi:hypothetical protein